MELGLVGLSGLVGSASLLLGELEPNRRDDLHEELMMQARCRSAVISARQRPSSALRAAYALAASPAELLDAYDAVGGTPAELLDECNVARGNCVCVLVKFADSGLFTLPLLGDVGMGIYGQAAAAAVLGAFIVTCAA